MQYTVKGFTTVQHPYSKLKSLDKGINLLISVILILKIIILNKYVSLFNNTHIHHKSQLLSVR